jgi:hypothetical protein
MACLIRDRDSELNTCSHRIECRAKKNCNQTSIHVGKENVESQIPMKLS